MRKYGYVTDGTPVVDEAPAHILTELLAVLEEGISERFWETQAESYRPEDREWLCAHLMNVGLADFIDAGTRNTVRFFTSCFTPEVCSMH